MAVVEQRGTDQRELRAVHAAEEVGAVERAAGAVRRVVRGRAFEQPETAHEVSLLGETRVDVAARQPRREGLQRFRIAQRVELVLDHLVAVKALRILEDELPARGAGAIDLRLMEEREVAQRMSGREKRRELRRRGAPLAGLDQRARVQVGERPARVLRRMRLLDLPEQRGQLLPSPAVLERHELRGPVGGRRRRHGGHRRRGAEDAAPRHGLPRQENDGDDDDGEDGDYGEKDSARLGHESSRASVPDTMAWGARLRISYLAIG